MSTKFCKHCGLSFEPVKKTKGFYCSRSCYFAHKRHNAGHITEGRVRKILDLYHNGLFIKPIASEVGTTFYKVKEVLLKAGVFDRSRVRPQHIKGYNGHIRKKVTTEMIAARIVAQEYKHDAKNNKRFTDSDHWKNHPEAKRWAANKSASSQYKKWKNCPAVLIKYRLRSRINRVLTGKLKSASTLVLLGCSLEQFRSYLESQFKPGMTWKNYGKAWHIDHKEPCSSFDLSKPKEQQRCFHYSNLQPLWAKENRCKHARILPTQRELIMNLNEIKR